MAIIPQPSHKSTSQATTYKATCDSSKTPNLHVHTIFPDLFLTLPNIKSTRMHSISLTFYKSSPVFALAFFVYKLVKDKNLVLGCIAAVIILLLPIPNLVDFQFSAFFPSYYWGYALANAHVIQAHS